MRLYRAARELLGLKSRLLLLEALHGFLLLALQLAPLCLKAAAHRLADLGTAVRYSRRLGDPLDPVVAAVARLRAEENGAIGKVAVCDLERKGLAFFRACLDKAAAQWNDTLGVDVKDASLRKRLGALLGVVEQKAVLQHEKPARPLGALVAKRQLHQQAALLHLSVHNNVAAICHFLCPPPCATEAALADAGTARFVDVVSLGSLTRLARLCTPLSPRQLSPKLLAASLSACYAGFAAPRTGGWTESSRLKSWACWCELPARSSQTKQRCAGNAASAQRCTATGCTGGSRPARRGGPPVPRAPPLGRNRDGLVGLRSQRAKGPRGC
eukprot:m.3314 g.3314  ORF g.3314 m.3314 type:complete len:327 (+) comp2294_c0_seq1:1113-2093(+)